MCTLISVDQKQIGERLRQHRTKQPKISLYRLAAETNVLTAAGISNYESGYRRLKAREAKILSEAFRRLGRPISAAKLLDIEETPETRIEQSRDDTSVLQKESHRRLSRIVELWPKLEPDTQERLLNDAQDSLNRTSTARHAYYSVQDKKKTKGFRIRRIK